MRLALLALAALALTGCATWDGINFGLSVATADAAFATKAAGRLKDFQEHADIIVMSSHGSSVAQNTDLVIWLDQGAIRMMGDPHEVTGAYLEWAKGDTPESEFISDPEEFSA